MVRRKLMGLLIMVLLVAGCNTPLSDSISKSWEDSTPELIKVEITFTDDKALIGYVRALGIEQEKGRVYIGGSSLNYLYNQDGDIIGAYNYQRVLYMKIITEEQ